MATLYYDLSYFSFPLMEGGGGKDALAQSVECVTGQEVVVSIRRYNAWLPDFRQMMEIP